MLHPLTKELHLTDYMKAAVLKLTLQKCTMNQCELCPSKEGVSGRSGKWFRGVGFL